MATTRTEAFLTYNENDREKASSINDWLTRHGVQTHFWDRDIGIGEPVSEERQLLAAQTVVVLLGDAGWGPTHLQQVQLAASRGKILLPALIGDAPVEAREQVEGLFKEKRYIDVTKLDERDLNRLLQQIREHTVKTSGRVEYLVKTLIDKGDDERHEILAEIQRGTSFDRAVLGRRLREEISGPYSIRSGTQAGGNSPRDAAKMVSIRSWLLNALLWCDAEHEATREMVLMHVSQEEPEPNVRFWTLAGAYAVRASYLQLAVSQAMDDPKGEISDLAKAIIGHAAAIDPLRSKLASEEFTTAWEALRALRVAAIPALAGDLCSQLFRVVNGTALTYDVLYAISNPAIAGQVGQILRDNPGVDGLVKVVVDTSIVSNQPATVRFASLLAQFDRAQVRSLLTSRSSDPRAREAVRLILAALERGAPAENEPPRLPGFSSDAAEGQTDQLDIQNEVKTLAAIMMARDIGPPLAIGLFGDWGSGKTFFMDALIQVVRKLEQQVQAGRTQAFCANVVQIRFNAWHYVDTQLWPSLVTFILEQLAAYVSPTDSVRVQHAKLLAELDSAKARQAEIEGEHARASQALTLDEGKLTQIRNERMTKEVELADIRATDLLSLLGRNETVRKEVTEKLESAGVSAAITSVEDLEKAVDEAHRVRASAVELVVTTARQKSWPVYAGLLCLAVLVAPVTMFLLDRYASEIGKWVSAVSAVSAQVVALAVTAAAWLRKGSKIAQANIDKIQSAKVQVDELIKQKRSVISEEEKNLAAEVERLRANELQAQARLTAASERMLEAEARLNSFISAGSLSRFLADRTGSDDYRKHLGLISLVRRDFEALSERLSNQALLAGGQRVDRIILYIDDLDRCSAQTVVDVLQAVHLLLAFKLFVVVVGVDSRWLLSSLAVHYAELRGNDGNGGTQGKLATPQLYLEKIFQIPYTLRPMSTDGFSRLIAHVMKPTVEGGVGTSSPLAAAADTQEPANDLRVSTVSPSAGSAPIVTEDLPNSAAKTSSGLPAPASPVPNASPPVEDILVHEEALAVRPWEVRFAQSLHAFIPSPRAAKRLSNTYRLLKARLPVGQLGSFEGSDTLPGEFQVPMLLLAVLICEPDAAADWYLTLLESADGYASLADALVVSPPSGSSSSPDPALSVRAELAARIQPLASAATFPRDVTLLKSWIPRVARFSFDLSRRMERIEA